MQRRRCKGFRPLGKWRKIETDSPTPMRDPRRRWWWALQGRRRNVRKCKLRKYAPVSAGSHVTLNWLFQYWFIVMSLNCTCASSSVYHKTFSYILNFVKSLSDILSNLRFSFGWNWQKYYRQQTWRKTQIHVREFDIGTPLTLILLRSLKTIWLQMNHFACYMPSQLYPLFNDEKQSLFTIIINTTYSRDAQELFGNKSSALTE